MTFFICPCHFNWWCYGYDYVSCRRVDDFSRLSKTLLSILICILVFRWLLSLQDMTWASPNFLPIVYHTERCRRCFIFEWPLLIFSDTLLSILPSSSQFVLVVVVIVVAVVVAVVIFKFRFIVSLFPFTFFPIAFILYFTFLMSHSYCLPQFLSLHTMFLLSILLCLLSLAETKRLRLSPNALANRQRRLKPTIPSASEACWRVVLDKKKTFFLVDSRPEDAK